MAATPAATAFSITELVAAIILDLPIRSVFVMQMVCRCWRAIITSSIVLRQKTFGICGTDLRTVEEESSASKTSTFNPLTKDALECAILNEDPRWFSKEDSRRNLQLFMPPHIERSFQVHEDIQQTSYGEMRTKHQNECASRLGSGVARTQGLHFWLREACRQLPKEKHWINLNTAPHDSTDFESAPHEDFPYHISLWGGLVNDMRLK